MGAGEGHDPAMENDWPLLPFMALSDGAHTYDADRRNGQMETYTGLDLRKTSPISPFAGKAQMSDELRPCLEYPAQDR